MNVTNARAAEEVRTCWGRDPRKIFALLDQASMTVEAQHAILERARRDADEIDMDFDFTPDQHQLIRENGSHWLLLDMTYNLVVPKRGVSVERDSVVLRDLSTIHWKRDPLHQDHLLMRLAESPFVLVDDLAHPRLVMRKDPALYAQLVHGYDQEVIRALQDTWTGSLRSLLEASQLVTR